MNKQIIVTSISTDLQKKKTNLASVRVSEQVCLSEVLAAAFEKKLVHFKRWIRRGAFD